MQKTMLAVLAAAPALAKQPSASPQVLSVQTLHEGDVNIALPTVKNADGSICVSYVASAPRDTQDKLTTQVARIYGPASLNGEPRPAQLLSMREFRNSSLAVQLPTTKAE